MNTVLDDTRTLCLANSDRIKLTDNMRMLFEVQDLSAASPATVSRCGMVYMSSDDLGWRPYVYTWIIKFFKNKFNVETINHINDLFDKTVDGALLRFKQCKEPIPTFEIQLLTSLCNLLEAFLLPENGFNESDPADDQIRIFNN